VKLASIGVLALIMLIPLGLLMPVVSERAALRDGAVAEIHRDWGKAQTIIGPVLVIPIENGIAYAFPDELKVDGALAPEQRSRGIYASVVYSAKLDIAGSFRRPTANEIGVAPEKLRWAQAYVAIGVSDLRGTGTQVSLAWGKAKHAMLPGALLERYGSGLHVPVKAPAEGETIAFSLELPIHGSERVEIAPLGIRNDVNLRSSWPNPSFNGAFLPATRTVSDAGFTSTWSVSYYGRDFGQQGYGVLPPALEQSLFGVELLPGIDSYRSVDRAIRYGILFVVLALMSFFLFEVITKSRIHPFQYAMVGVALGVFFLLLLALSELVPFIAAYSAAAAGTIGLVTMYMLPVLKTGRRTLVATALLAASFGVLYVVLQAEDYALLAGALVVFVALAITMRLTRALDWYAKDAAPPATSSPAAPTLPQSPPATEEAR
jgi:inner membrane protein